MPGPSPKIAAAAWGRKSHWKPAFAKAMPPTPSRVDTVAKAPVSPERGECRGCPSARLGALSGSAELAEVLPDGKIPARRPMGAGHFIRDSRFDGVVPD